MRYVTNCNRLQATTTYDIILTNSPAYQTGPLARFINRPTARSIDKGSENVDAAGLTGYTILTNQSPDTGTVDMGLPLQDNRQRFHGTDFWLAFLFNRGPRRNNTFPLISRLYISSSVAASGTSDLSSPTGRC